MFTRRNVSNWLGLGLLALSVIAPRSLRADEGFEARRQWAFKLFTEGKHLFRTDRVQSAHLQARLYVSDGQDKAALEHIVTVLDNMWKKDDYGHDRHAGPDIVWALYKYGHRFSADQIERIKRAVTSKTFRRVTDHGTENHAMDFVATGYLLAQYFPGETWNTSEGPMTSQALMDLNRSRILSRGKGFYRVGHQELLSANYDPLSARSSLSLWEFARDPVVRDAGEALVLYHVGLQALNDFDGHIMAPYNRWSGGPRGRIWPNMSGLDTQAWLFWGQNDIVPGDTQQRNYWFLKDLIYWFVSDRRIPEPLDRIAQGAEAPYEIRGANGEYNTWGESGGLAMLRYVWRDRDFAIGGPTGESFHPGVLPGTTEDRQRGFYDTFRAFNIVWKSKNRFRLLEAMHPHWRSNQGEDYWNPTHSPFQQFGIHRNVAITMFNIPEKDPWLDRGRKNWIGLRDKQFNNLIKLGQVRFPTTVDEVVGNGDFYFFREGDVYVAIRALKPGHTVQKIEDLSSKPNVFHVVKSREARTGFVFEVGTAEKHGSFGAFQQAVMKNPLRVDWNALEVRYTSTHGDELRFRYDTNYKEDADGFIKIVPDLWINGRQREVDFEKWPLAESPVMTLKDSILRINQGGERTEVDWSGELPRISRR